MKLGVAGMGKKREYKVGYIIVQVNENGDIVDTFDATFDRATAEEMVMAFSEEWLWRCWYYQTHGTEHYDYARINYIFQVAKLSDAPIEIREIKWYE